MFHCEHCSEEVMRASGKTGLDHLRGFRRFQRQHQNCKLNAEMRTWRDEAGEMAKDVIQRAKDHAR